MDKARVEVTIGERRYRVSATADAEHLQHLAQLVDSKWQALPPLQRAHPDALVLVSLALAHELDEQRRSQETLNERYAERLTRLLARIDRVLGTVDEDGQQLPPVESAATRR